MEIRVGSFQIDVDTPDVMTRTMLRYRKHLEPLPHPLHIKVELAEQVPPAGFDPRFAYDGAISEGIFVSSACIGIGGEET